MTRKPSKSGHLFFQEEGPSKSPLTAEAQGIIASEIILRAVGVLMSEGVDPGIREARLLSAAVAQIQMRHGDAFAASALREWADRLDPASPSDAPPADATG